MLKEEKRKLIITLLEKKWTYQQIVAQSGASTKTIRKIKKEMERQAKAEEFFSAVKDFEIIYNFNNLCNISKLTGSFIGSFGFGCAAILFEDLSFKTVRIEEVKKDLVNKKLFIYADVGGIKVKLERELAFYFLNFALFNRNVDGSELKDQQVIRLVEKYIKNIIKDVIKEALNIKL